MAGKNDSELLKKTGNGRDINRHFYSKDEVKNEVNKKIVKKIFQLCRLRNSHQAFLGKFKLKQLNRNKLSLFWENQDQKLILNADFIKKRFEIIDTKKAKISSKR